MGDVKMPHSQHEKHLCFLQNTGHLNHSIEDYKALVKEAKYVCKGCGLGERLDSAQLAQIAQKEGKAQVVREHEFLCNADGVATIRKDIDSEGVNHVVIAACSRRSKVEAFNFEDVAVARANLREGVIWSQPDTDEARELTQEAEA